MLPADTMQRILNYRNSLRNSLFEQDFLTQKSQLDIFTDSEVFLVKKEQPKKEVKRVFKTGVNMYSKALKIESSNAYDLTLQYFISGGRVCKDALQKLFGNKRGKDISKEIATKRALIDDKKGSGIFEIAHYLWENLPDYVKNIDTMDFRECIEEILIGFNNIKQMTKALINRHKETLNDFMPQYIPSSEEVAEIEPFEDYQLDENFEPCPF